jgi:Flp pilus assembly protein TadG
VLRETQVRRPVPQETGAVAIETVLFLPLLFILLLGTLEIGRIAYTYATLQKIMGSIARYAGTQQGVNFCDDGDPNVVAAKNFGITGTADGSANPIVAGLTADMIQVRVERFNSDSGSLDQCDCSVNGCGTSNGGLPPDFIVVSMPSGYPFSPRIPLIPTDPIPLKPTVRIPYGGT